MAASTRKKVVGKDALRRLMKEKTGSVKTTSKKIDSPLAKYNTLDQLICAVCNSQVKSELLWNAHILSKTHKQNIAALKEAKQKKEEAIVQLPSHLGKAKRKQPDDIYAVRDKVAKLQKQQEKEKSDSSHEYADNSSNASDSKSAGLGLGYGSSEESDDEDNETFKKPAPLPVPGSTAKPTAKGLPSDFFDPGVVASGSGEVAEEEKPSSMAEKLPEGFFDDPKMDAKVRQVEYRDKMEDEWEMFQRAMKEQTTISEAILEVDEAEATAERIVDEIDDQMQRWSKVDELAKRKEQLLTTEGENTRAEQESDSDVDEEEFEEFLDWRSKKVWK